MIIFQNIIQNFNLRIFFNVSIFCAFLISGQIYAQKSEFHATSLALENEFLFDLSSNNEQSLLSLSQNQNQTNIPTAEDLKLRSIYIESIKFYQIEEYQKAIKSLNEALSIIENNASIDYLMSVCYLKIKNYDKALAFIKHAIVLNGENKFFYVLWANIYECQNEFLKAIEIYNRLIKKFKINDNIDLYMKMASLHISVLRYSQALDNYNSIEKIRGLTPGITHKKVLLLDQLGKISTGNQEMIRLFEYFPKHYPSLVFQTERMIQQKKYKKALTSLNKAKKINFIDSKLIKLQLKLNQLLPESMIQSTQWLTDENLSLEEKIQKIDQLIANKNMTFLTNNLDEIIRLYPENKEINLRVAKVHQYNQKNDLALQIYLKCLKDDYQILEYWFLVWQIEIELNKIEHLIASTLNALDYYPNQAKIYFYLGKGYFMNKNFQKAEKYWKEGEYLGRKNTIGATIRYELLNLYLAQKHYTKYFLTLKRQIDFGFEPNTNKLLYCKMALNFDLYLEESLEYAKQLLEIEPNKIAYLVIQTSLLIENNEIKNAEILIDKIKNILGDSSVEIFELQGDINFKLKHYKKAKNMWKKAQLLKPSLRISDKLNKIP